MRRFAFFALDGRGFRFQVGSRLCYDCANRRELFIFCGIFRSLVCVRSVFAKRFQLCSQAAHLLLRFVVLMKSVGNLPVEFELPAQIFRRSSHPRVHADFERLRVALAANRKHYFVLSGQHRRAQRIARRVVVDGRDWVFMFQHIGLGISQIPEKAMHSRRGRQSSRRTHPVGRYIQFFRIHRLGLVVARKMAHGLSR